MENFAVGEMILLLEEEETNFQVLCFFFLVPQNLKRLKKKNLRFCSLLFPSFHNQTPVYPMG